MTKKKGVSRRPKVAWAKSSAETKKTDMGPLVWVRILEAVAGDRYSFQFNQVVQIGEKRATPWVAAGIAEFVPDPDTISDPQHLAARIAELDAENAELRQQVEDLMLGADPDAVESVPGGIGIGSGAPAGD